MADRPKTVTAYISCQSQEAQNRLEELRGYLRLADPDANEELKWGKPAFVNDGILYIYAAFKTHISLHPTPSVVNAFRKDLENYRVSDNTIRFPLEAAIPEELVLKIARWRIYEKKEKGIGWK